MQNATNDSPSILVFDSGVGGISIAQEIKKQLPNLTLHYGADNQCFPYGEQPEVHLTKRVVEVCHKMVESCEPSILVVACNTASTVALPHLRDNICCPVVGVVPAIKPAAEQSKTKSIALVATEGTVNRNYTQNLINQYAGDCHVRNVPAPELVRLAEDKLRGLPVSKDSLIDVITRVFGEEKQNLIDTVVLACTHFPLLKQELIHVSPYKVDWIDSGEAIARRVSWLLSDMGLTDSSLSTSGLNKLGKLLLTTNDLSFSNLHSFKQLGCQYNETLVL